MDEAAGDDDLFARADNEGFQAVHDYVDSCSTLAAVEKQITSHARLVDPQRSLRSGGREEGDSCATSCAVLLSNGEWLVAVSEEDSVEKSSRGVESSCGVS